MNLIPLPLYIQETQSVPTEQRADWAPEPGWAIWRGEIRLAYALIRASDRLTRSLVVIRNTLSTVPSQIQTTLWGLFLV